MHMMERLVTKICLNKKRNDICEQDITSNGGNWTEAGRSHILVASSQEMLIAILVLRDLVLRIRPQTAQPSRQATQPASLDSSSSWVSSKYWRVYNSLRERNSYKKSAVWAPDRTFLPLPPFVPPCSSSSSTETMVRDQSHRGPRAAFCPSSPALWEQSLLISATSQLSPELGQICESPPEMEELSEIIFLRNSLLRLIHTSRLR